MHIYVCNSEQTNIW